jgi:hypothetical protein
LVFEFTLLEIKKRLSLKLLQTIFLLVMRNRGLSLTLVRGIILIATSTLVIFVLVSNTFFQNTKSSSLALVIPFAKHQEDIVLASLDQGWPIPCKKYRAKSLIFYYNNNIKANPQLQRNILQKASKFKRCFESIKFLSAHLTGEKDKYPNGPSHMFFRLFNPIPLVLKGIDNIYYMEPDNIPCRPLWLDQLVLEATQSQPLWMRGSLIRDGNPENGLASFAPHINGNAFYSMGIGFTSWLKRVEEQFWRNGGLYLDSYDIALYLMRMDREFYGFDEFAETAHLFQYTDTVVNFYRTPGSAAEICEERKGTFLVHGRNIEP